MRFEIERRFLVDGEGWRDDAVSSLRLTDGLVSQTRDGKVRVRTCGSAAWLTVKGPRRGLARTEQEFDISPSAAQGLIEGACCGRVIEKTRHRVPIGDAVWCVDAFHGRFEGLVWAEIELEHEDQSFQRPAWLGEEVSSDVRFRQSYLLALAETGSSFITVPEILASGAAGDAREPNEARSEWSPREQTMAQARHREGEAQ